MVCKTLRKKKVPVTAAHRTPGARETQWKRQVFCHFGKIESWLNSCLGNVRHTSDRQTDATGVWGFVYGENPQLYGPGWVADAKTQALAAVAHHTCLAHHNCLTHHTCRVWCMIHMGKRGTSYTSYCRVCPYVKGLIVPEIRLLCDSITLTFNQGLRDSIKIPPCSRGRFCSFSRQKWCVCFWYWL